MVLGLDFSLKQVANAWKSGMPSLTKEEPIRQKPSHRTFSEDYHHGFVPLSSAEETYGPFAVKYFINSLGMRDRTNRYVTPGKPFGGRILLLGDSYTDGVGMEFEDTLAGRLSDRLVPAGVEVLNGGTASYCPTLLAARLDHWVRRDNLRFDLALVFVDISDVRDELRYVRNTSGKFQQNDSRRLEEAVRAEEETNRPFRVWLEARVDLS